MSIVKMDYSDTLAVKLIDSGREEDGVPLSLATKKTVIVADGHEMVRDGITLRIEQGCNVNVVAQTEDGYSTLKAVRQHKPSLLIMDLGLMRPSGTDVLAKLAGIHADMKIVVVTSDPTVSNAYFAFSQGATAFMPKQVSANEFIHAVNAAISGFSYLPEDVLSQFVQSRGNLTRLGNIFGLSARELEILRACSEGQSTKEVADDLNISVRTVETHRHNIYRKTNCNSQQELKRIAECVWPAA